MDDSLQQRATAIEASMSSPLGQLIWDCLSNEKASAKRWGKHWGKHWKLGI
jgi:hypothetical protein